MKNRQHCETLKEYNERITARQGAKTFHWFRDKKGRFASREKQVERLRFMIFTIEQLGTNRPIVKIRGVCYPAPLIRVAGKTIASLIRQLRNQYRIYETF